MSKLTAEEKKEIAERLDKERIKKGLSVADMAKLIDKSPRQVKRYLSGETMISLYDLWILSQNGFDINFVSFGIPGFLFPIHSALCTMSKDMYREYLDRAVLIMETVGLRSEAFSELVTELAQYGIDHQDDPAQRELPSLYDLFDAFKQGKDPEELLAVYQNPL